MLYSFSSKKGPRETNEDRHTIVINCDGKNGQQSPVNFFGLYDGHAGTVVSNYLAKNLYKKFTHKLMRFPLDKKYVDKAFNDIQNNLWKIPNNISGSTSLFMIEYETNVDKGINIVNLGDCRAVLCRGFIAVPLTRDHKPVSNPVELNRIKKLDGLPVNDQGIWRINGLSVSRAFGDFDATPHVTHLPEVFKYKLTNHDKFVILGCDGVWDVLSNEEAVNIVLKRCYNNLNTLNSNYVHAAKYISDRAYKKNTMDNVSIIVVFFEQTIE